MARLSRGQRAGAGTTALLVMALLSLVLLVMLILGLVAVPAVPRRFEDDATGAVVELKLPSHQHWHRNDNVTKPWVEVLSWEPRAFLYHHMLTQDECNHLIQLAKPTMVKSTVVDSATGKSKDSRVRTSSGTFLSRGQDKVITGIEQRIADFTFIPLEQGEGLQVLQYKVGEKYEPHYDYFHDIYNTKNGGQRIATVLMYLTDVEQGGETVFPASRVNSSEVPHWDELSECAQKGLSVRPHMGDALLFWSMKPDATLDSTSLHGGPSDQLLAAAVPSSKAPSGQPRSGCMLISMQCHKVSKFIFDRNTGKPSADTLSLHMRQRRVMEKNTSGFVMVTAQLCHTHIATTNNRG